MTDPIILDSSNRSRTINDFLSPLHIWLMPQIVGVNICLNIKNIGDNLKIGKNENGKSYIEGISAGSRVENYKIKRKKRKNEGASHPLYNSFHVNIYLANIDDIINIGVVSTGRFRVAGSKPNANDAVDAVKVLCKEIMSQFEPINSQTWWFAEPVYIINNYIESRSANKPLWAYTSDKLEFVKRELKENLKKYNCEYNKSVSSLKGLLGFSTKPSPKQLMIYCVFPTFVRAKTVLSYKTNCEKVYKTLKKQNYLVRHDPFINTNVEIFYPITKDYEKTIEINNSGSITFKTKTEEETNELYEIAKYIFNNNRKAFEHTDTINLGDSTSSDEDIITNFMTHRIIK